MATDIFDSKIFCSKCNVEMEKVSLAKNGFLLRAVVCPKCGEKIIHPHDDEEYNKYINLKTKAFEVKMRLVGNSYAVSIPKEIVSFMESQRKMINSMVKLCFEDLGKVSLDFGNFSNIGMNSLGEESQNGNHRVIKANEMHVVKNGKPVLHVRQFTDSENPKNNKTQVFREKE